MNVPLMPNPEAYAQLNAQIAVQPEDAQIAIMRALALNDLFYLLVYVLRRPDANNAFVFEKCRMVQAEPWGYLDLWAREHYKSTIITFAHNIQTILNDPERTICIFSHSRPIAKGFLRQIKRELEENELLKELFPDILWSDPKKEAPKWSEDDGLIVKRKSNPNESSFEAWGLVDGQPTSKHFSDLNYDDTVTQKSVTEGMIPKTTEAWEHSLNLGRVGGNRRYIGTIYSKYDSYSTMRERGIPVRLFPGTVDGTFEGEPIFWTREILKNKRAEMGSDTFATQILLRPEGSGHAIFNAQDLRFYQPMATGGPANWRYMYRCLLVDPANEKKKNSDWTSMLVLGFAADENIYILDWVRDRLSLPERIKHAIRLHRKWQLAHFDVGWERYGKDADIDALNMMQAQLSYHFEVTRLGGPMPKRDRIQRLQAYFERKQIWLPAKLEIVDYEGKVADLVQRFIKHEFTPYPDVKWDDDLDNLARFLDLYKAGLPFPTAENYQAMDAVGGYDEMTGSTMRTPGVDAVVDDAPAFY